MMQTLPNFESATDSLPELIRHLRHRLASTRLAAVKALGKLGWQTGESVAALSSSLNDEDELVRESAAQAIGQLGPNAVSAMIRMLNNKDKYVRRHAVWALGKLGPKAVPEDRWVESKSVSARVFILSAGVIMNIVLTLFVTSGIYYVYGNPYRPAVVDSVVVGAPAAVAGVRSGDVIVRVNGDSVHSWDEVIDHIAPVVSGTVSLDVARGTERVAITVAPQVVESPDPVTGALRKIGRVGISVRDSVARDPVGITQAVGFGATATWAMATNVAGVLKGLTTGTVSRKNLGGPIQIAQVSVQAARRGAETLWSLIAFLSLNIAILNLVPIPVLDGGQILLVLAERIKGSSFTAGTREAFARIGVLAVAALILFVTFNDISRMFTR